MVIDKIGNINNIVDAKKTRPSSGNKEVNKGDSVQLSSEARQAADVARLSQMVQTSPDMRAERVQELKEQIANGEYNFDDSKILNMVADRIADFLIRR
jgi:flagellar biosynthesis anti-sigma factor FlgM